MFDTSSVWMWYNHDMNMRVYDVAVVCIRLGLILILWLGEAHITCVKLKSWPLVVALCLHHACIVLVNVPLPLTRFWALHRDTSLKEYQKLFSERLVLLLFTLYVEPCSSVIISHQPDVTPTVHQGIQQLGTCWWFIPSFVISRLL